MLKRTCIPLLALLTLLAPAAASARPQRTPHAKGASSLRALLRSRELWATIDVCNTAKQPDTVGVRGSMPGDGHAHDQMSMSFHLEYLNAVNQWVELEGSGSSAFIAVGSAGASRQGGSSFTLKPHPDRPAYALRGIVDFRWTHGKAIVQTARRPTTSGHEAAVGAEPKSYSAAECSVG